MTLNKVIDYSVIQFNLVNDKEYVEEHLFIPKNMTCILCSIRLSRSRSETNEANIDIDKSYTNKQIEINLNEFLKQNNESKISFINQLCNYIKLYDLDMDNIPNQIKEYMLWI